ncbi:ribonuclease III [Halomicronema sp. CCY15110]|uniref:ribonuclease III n=1 Tax=Halomicronema sp. CCY15110 TaxID=2767773 RepID=UPI0019527C83|nr:ribonuclease III [Halomicronema sp. CCY15110]
MASLPSFHNAALFIQAMTHKSYAREHPDAGGDNERLEFLGDAILTFLCGEFLFARYPDKPEGELTPLRASLVDATQLGKFAQQLSLQTHIRLGKGVEGSDGRTNARLLSSAFEALIGAYFLDQRSQIAPVREFVFPLFEAVVDDFTDPTRNINEKSTLQEWSLGRSGVIPTYEIVSESGPDHAKEFTAIVRIASEPYGRGQGRSKQDAQKAAARDALQQLRLL